MPEAIIPMSIFVPIFVMAPVKYPSDVEWISAINRGEAPAFEALVRRYTSKLLEHAVRRLRNQAEAEDLVQDVFAGIWEKRRDLHIETSLEGYLHTSLKYRVLRRIARAGLHAEAVKHLLGRMNEMQAGILDVLEARDLETTLSEVVGSLPLNMRRIFILRQEDHSLREIAQALGLAEQTVRNYHTEAVRRIREALLRKHPDISRSFLVALTCLLTNN